MGKDKPDEGRARGMSNREDGFNQLCIRLREDSQEHPDDDGAEGVRMVIKRLCEFVVDCGSSFGIWLCYLF
ncbi:hypothetical protein FOZ60_016012 [Perkinsus olseni]|uniref:Uncharacterized protein n=1 Tax=Perkinsus olseni TaxID=32597 RepID=A0A7J6P532_PEROL|nr:hypothetical protein FOZ60_016012 [Perkinsus olseni]